MGIARRINTCVILIGIAATFTLAQGESPREAAKAHWAFRDDPARCAQAIASLESALADDPSWEEGWIWLSHAYYWDGNNKPESDTKGRKASYQAGMDAGKKARALNEMSVGGAFWYIVNKSSYGRERGIVASATYLPEINEVTGFIEKTDPSYFYGGVHRLNARIIMKTPGWLRSAKGYDLGDAKAELDKALAVDGRFTLTHLYLADLYVQMEKPELAREQLEIVLNTPEDAVPGEEAVVRRDRQEARKRMTALNFGD